MFPKTVLKLFLYVRPILLSAMLSAPAGAQIEKKVLCEDIKRPFFKVSCAKGGHCAAAPARSETRAREFTVPKPEGAKLMFVLGESAAALLGDGDSLTESVPDFRLINCGMSNYDSYRTAGVFKETLEYKPDLLVVISGSNEGREYPCEGEAVKQRIWRRSVLEKLYGLRYGARLAPGLASLRIHKARLEEMAEQAKAKKIPLILCTLPVNLGGAPPSGPLPLENEAFAAGMAAFENKKYEQAAGLFNESLKKNGNEPFSLFYLAKTLEALKRFPEAKAAYLRALNSDNRPGQPLAERNEMIRSLAAKEGAGLCDLELAYYNSAKNGIPGFEQLSDTSFLKPLIWDELLKTADAMGLDGFRELPVYPSEQMQPEEELKKNFSAAVIEIDKALADPLLAPAAAPYGGVMSENALAGIEYAESRWPAALERTALSEAAFKNLFLACAWSERTVSRLGILRPHFLAHLAEVQRRSGNFRKALELAERAIAADAGKLYFRQIKALALAGLGRKKEAEKELAALYTAPALRKRAQVLGRAYGLALPEAGSSPDAAKRSKKLADEGTGKLRAGDAAAAEKLLAEAAKLNLSNAEAYLSLCSAQFAQKKFQAALESCDAARWGAQTYYPAARLALISDASYLKAQALAKLGSKAAAGAELKKALQDPPPGWKNLEAAKAELEKAAGK